MEPIPYIPSNTNTKIINDNYCYNYQRNSPNVMMKELNWLNKIEIKSLPVSKSLSKVYF